MDMSYENEPITASDLDEFFESLEEITAPTTQLIPIEITPDPLPHTNKILQLEMDLKVSYFENSYLAAENEKLKTELEETRRRLDSREAELKNDAHTRGLFSSAIVDLQGMVEEDQTEIRRLRNQLEVLELEKWIKLENEWKLNRLTQFLQPTSSFVEDTLGRPLSSSSPDAYEGEIQSVDVVPSRTLENFSERKHDQQQQVMNEMIPFSTEMMNKAFPTLQDQNRGNSRFSVPDPKPVNDLAIIPVTYAAATALYLPMGASEDSQGADSQVCPHRQSQPSNPSVRASGTVSGNFKTKACGWLKPLAKMKTGCKNCRKTGCLRYNL